MTSIKNVPTQAGIVVSTAIRAGERGDPCPIGTCTNPKNHAEGIVVSTAIRAGERGDPCPSGTCTNPKNHAEGLVLR